MLPMTLPASSVDNTSVRELERNSIRTFVMSCADQLTGRVLDYGCGKQPYRDIVEAAGGDYHGFDRAEFPANVSGENVGGPIVTGDIGYYNAILCNQMLQYVPLYGDMVEATYPDSECPSTPLLDLLGSFHSWLGGGGTRARERHGDRWLVLTYPTTWSEVEPQDLCRFTAAGMHDLLELVGFTIVRHEQRAHINLGGFRLPLGYGVLARA